MLHFADFSNIPPSYEVCGDFDCKIVMATNAKRSRKQVLVLREDSDNENDDFSDLNGQTCESNQCESIVSMEFC